MATYVPAKRGVQYITYLGLVDQTNRPQFKANPTLAAGDVKVSIDGGTLNNITSLPVVAPAGSKLVQVTLSTSEMNGDVISVIFSDAAGAEWDDVIVTIPTTARQIDDLLPTASISLSTGAVTVGTNNDKTGYALSTGGVQAIWDALTSALTTVGSIGKRLADDIDATISSRSTYAGGAVASVTAPVTVGTNSDKTGYALTSAYDPAKTSAQAGDAMALTGGERTTLAGVIWSALTSGLTAVGSIGKLLVDNINATITSRLAASGYTAPDNAGIASANAVIAALNNLSASQVENAAWDAVLASHLTPGTTGAALNASGSSGDPWITPLPGAYAAGTAGSIVGNNLNAPVSGVPAAVLKQDMSTVTGESPRSPMNAIRKLMNKVGIAGGTLTVYKEDDLTPAYTQTISSDPTQSPIQSLDTN